MIGNSPFNEKRWTKLWRLKEAGFRGRVSVTAYYAADIYTITDTDVFFEGRVRFMEEGWCEANFSKLYTAYVTDTKRL